MKRVMLGVARSSHSPICFVDQSTALQSASFYIPGMPTPRSRGQALRTFHRTRRCSTFNDRSFHCTAAPGLWNSLAPLNVWMSNKLLGISKKTYLWNLQRAYRGTKTDDLECRLTGRRQKVVQSRALHGYCGVAVGHCSMRIALSIILTPGPGNLLL
jgi:hypothetical protein